MSKQVLVSWTPSVSTDVEKQIVKYSLKVKGSDEFVAKEDFELNPEAALWSTKQAGEAVNEGDTIRVTIETFDFDGLRDLTPLTGEFTVPPEPPVSATNLGFEVRPFEEA